MDGSQNLPPSPSTTTYVCHAIPDEPKLGYGQQNQLRYCGISQTAVASTRPKVERLGVVLAKRDMQSLRSCSPTANRALGGQQHRVRPHPATPAGNMVQSQQEKRRSLESTLPSSHKELGSKFSHQSTEAARGPYETSVIQGNQAADKALQRHPVARAASDAVQQDVAAAEVFQTCVHEPWSPSAIQQCAAKAYLRQQLLSMQPGPSA